MLFPAPVGVPLDRLAAQDVIWTRPSEDASGSMPIGNGEVVLNVWVEAKTGDVLFYIARTDAVSEISRYLKLGRVRLHMEPSPFAHATAFSQHLRLYDGTIEIKGGGTALSLFVDANSHVIHLSGASRTSGKVTAELECWRNTPRTIPKDEQGSAWSVHDAPFPLVESADKFISRGRPEILWCHRNETSIVPKLWENQSLTGLDGLYDTILHRTFGGVMFGPGFAQHGQRGLQTAKAVKRFELSIATHSAQTPTIAAWEVQLDKISRGSVRAAAFKRTKAWWHGFWDRSWVLVEGDRVTTAVPKNNLPMRKGMASNGQEKFSGDIRSWTYIERSAPAGEIKELVDKTGPLSSAQNKRNPDFKDGLTLSAWIRPSDLNSAGRIFDKITAGGTDGFLFDTYPGGGLRLLVGSMTLLAPSCLKPQIFQHVAATYDPETGQAAIYVSGTKVATTEPVPISPVSRSYALQRFVQACQGRGWSPIKFNGGFYTVEPKNEGKPFNADWRAWGDCHWLQNLRHMYGPMPAQGDFEMMDPFFRLYEKALPLAEARSKAYHNAEGAYFPETMTLYGTYSGGDYGWDRTGHTKADVLCPYWQFAWNQGPEIVSLMLDRWDYTRDSAFLKNQVFPMATAVLKYFDTRFQKDSAGRIVLDPSQSVETYWYGVVNDMPSTSGLISITQRLCALPRGVLTSTQAAFFRHMEAACPELPVRTVDGEVELAPAQKYETRTSNSENPALYGVWPFRVVSMAHPARLEEARRAYAHRLNHNDVGWGYDGNAAALLGLTDEAARILEIKCANSHAGYRWPATWGPNYDWLPDQNHGGNLLNTTNLMLLQSEPLEVGGAIRLLPAWPKTWDVDFRLHAPGNTIVTCQTKGGRIVKLDVTPESRKKDVILPQGWRVVGARGMTQNELRRVLP